MNRNCCGFRKQRSFPFLILVVCSFFLPNMIYAQVTIGSDRKSNLGALLDLKQNQDGTSSKGLGLPRVILDSLRISKGTELSSTIKGATGTWDKEEHVGLMVYNVSEYDPCDSYTFKPGPYVWDGEKWKFLGKTGRAMEIREFQDPRDGKVYLYRRFGVAGEWMVENMRYIHPNFRRSYIVNHPQEQIYAYPNPDPGSTEGDAIPETWRPEQGLLYTYAAITLGVQNSLEVNQGVVDTLSEVDYETIEGPYPPIQGICPPGWHIPSDKEWTELEKEIYTNADKYSRYVKGDELFPFNPTDWNDKEWNQIVNQPRGALSEGGHGIAMLSECPPVGSTTPTGGKSLPSSLGGFNILLVGGTDEMGVLGAYGTAAGYWTSSAYGPEYAWFRLFDIQYGAQAQVPRGIYGRGTLTALRCKRGEGR